MQERDKYRKTKQSSDDGTCVGGYSKKKLVQGELTKADCGVDFAASFASKTHSDKDMADSWRRVSNLGEGVWWVGPIRVQMWCHAHMFINHVKYVLSHILTLLIHCVLFTLLLHTRAHLHTYIPTHNVYTYAYAHIYIAHTYRIAGYFRGCKFS